MHQIAGFREQIFVKLFLQEICLLYAEQKGHFAVLDIADLNEPHLFNII
jgi:hypothetical protein